METVCGEMNFVWKVKSDGLIEAGSTLNFHIWTS